MVRRGLVLAVLALAACGPAERNAPLHVSLMVESAAPMDSYAIRVFGAAVKCGDVLASPTRYELGGGATCTPDALDSSSACLIAYGVFTASGGTNRLSDIPAGERAVFVEGLQGGTVVARGCAAVTVSAGASASASVTLQ